MRALLMDELKTVWELAKLSWNDPGPVGQDAFWALVGHFIVWLALFILGRKLYRWVQK